MTAALKLAFPLPLVDKREYYVEFLKQVGDYAKDVQAARYIGQGLSVTFDHMQRRPITVQYLPYEKLIPEAVPGRDEFDKCIS